MLDTLTTTLAGIDPVATAYTFGRMGLGAFFAISGYHKLFCPERHQLIYETMVADHVPLPRFNSWFVPTVEFAGGLALIVGLLTPLAALGLLVVCIVACAVDGVKRIPAMKPLDRADWLDDLLYLPETIYAMFLAVYVFQGAGPWSLDAVLLSLIG